MAAETSPTPETCDAFVVGAGLAGTAAAIGLARAGFSTVSCGPLDRLGQGRTVALFGRSIELLREFGVWDEVEAIAAPLRSLRIVDDTGSLFSAAPVEFHASEIELEAFGWNIENAALADALAKPLEACPGLTRSRAKVDRFDFAPEAAGLTTSDGRRFSARLVVGADGRGSAARKAAGIDATLHRYGQSAMTLFLAHSRPHEDFSTEFHTREGPFTLVPLPPTAKSANRSSLVWVMSEKQGRRRAALKDADLLDEIDTQSRGLLGAMALEGGRGLFPMVRQVVRQLTGTRIALVGDAAHAFPPIGAQGLNLGLRDVDGLLKAVRGARDNGIDIGGATALADYAAARGPDIAARMLAVNGLNLSLLVGLSPVDALRGLGLTALRNVGPLRRLVMREGVSPMLGR